ncbi:hypothetical protein SARC_06896 [Sphaeroforma arctica JP610]|uniref:Pentacotripeptide-repeat region of PRORP domain-containing protein n=1 Tax=Sphaeroforma arctica JP610 TaxID=667725 RepID=A0A0L0FV97_9EUKA|nr:hypothetical protein SARC_06896 [Sphaeroforma arctica JP610]KNC80752.1 hypothetical protein SARC_06896 [Sphaeroforma arctica JP610]|eukprot:XP_014154654.1 hypothetical protein SARC_06896 [Sphaeroforma arctica JP610]
MHAYTIAIQPYRALSNATYNQTPGGVGTGIGTRVLSEYKAQHESVGKPHGTISGSTPGSVKPSQARGEVEATSRENAAKQGPTHINEDSRVNELVEGQNTGILHTLTCQLQSGALVPAQYEDAMHTFKWYEKPDLILRLLETMAVAPPRVWRRDLHFHVPMQELTKAGMYEGVLRVRDIIKRASNERGVADSVGDRIANSAVGDTEREAYGRAVHESAAHTTVAYERIAHADVPPDSSSVSGLQKILGENSTRVRIQPTLETTNYVLVALGHLRKPDNAMGLIRHMTKQEETLRPNNESYAAAISACDVFGTDINREIGSDRSVSGLRTWTIPEVRVNESQGITMMGSIVDNNTGANTSAPLRLRSTFGTGSEGTYRPTTNGRIADLVQDTKPSSVTSGAISNRSNDPRIRGYLSEILDGALERRKTLMVRARAGTGECDGVSALGWLSKGLVLCNRMGVYKTSQRYLRALEKYYPEHISARTYIHVASTCVDAGQWRIAERILEKAASALEASQRMNINGSLDSVTNSGNDMTYLSYTPLHEVYAEMCAESAVLTNVWREYEQFGILNLKGHSPVLAEAAVRSLHHRTQDRVHTVAGVYAHHTPSHRRSAALYDMLRRELSVKKGARLWFPDELASINPPGEPIQTGSSASVSELKGSGGIPTHSQVQNSSSAKDTIYGAGETCDAAGEKGNNDSPCDGVLKLLKVLMDDIGVRERWVTTPREKQGTNTTRGKDRIPTDTKQGSDSISKPFAESRGVRTSEGRATDRRARNPVRVLAAQSHVGYSGSGLSISRSRLLQFDLRDWTIAQILGEMARLCTAQRKGERLGEIRTDKHISAKDMLRTHEVSGLVPVVKAMLHRNMRLNSRDELSVGMAIRLQQKNWKEVVRLYNVSNGDELSIAHTGYGISRLNCMGGLIRANPLADDEAYNTLLQALLHGRQWHEAVNVVKIMREHRCMLRRDSLLEDGVFRRDTRAFSMVVTGLCKQAEWNTMGEVLAEMRRCGAKWDTRTFNCAILREARVGENGGTGMEIFDDMQSSRNVYADYGTMVAVLDILAAGEKDKEAEVDSMYDELCDSELLSEIWFRYDTTGELDVRKHSSRMVHAAVRRALRLRYDRLYSQVHDRLVERHQAKRNGEEVGTGDTSALVHSLIYKDEQLRRPITLQLAKDSSIRQSDRGVQGASVIAGRQPYMDKTTNDSVSMRSMVRNCDGEWGRDQHGRVWTVGDGIGVGVHGATMAEDVAARLAGDMDPSVRCSESVKPDGSRALVIAHIDVKNWLVVNIMKVLRKLRNQSHLTGNKDDT